MEIYYTDKIENFTLGYILYLNLKDDTEYWEDLQSDQIWESEEAGEVRGVRLGRREEIKKKIIE